MKQSNQKSWFDIDVKGFKALQEGRPKTFIINELTQNAFDEDTAVCDISIRFLKQEKQIHIVVMDDSPEGFRDISHAYTLFANTYKRLDPKKRGRFNLGEKQVISLCSYAKVMTTKGTIVFDDTGRHEFPEKRSAGSLVELYLDGTQKEVDELIKHSRTIIPPESVKYMVNGTTIHTPAIFASYKTILQTEVLINDVMELTKRKTEVRLIQPIDNKPMIYEMGIPIAETDCEWSIDVQQKIPLNIDRNSVRHAFRQDLYSSVLNETFNEITEPSATWVRMATKDKNTTDEAIKAVMHQRFGDKFCIANPLDKFAMDEALSQGYAVIHGGQLSKEEWARIKEATGIESVTQKFNSKDLRECQPMPVDSNMQAVASYAYRIAERILGIKIDVKFVNSPGNVTLASYGNRTLIFNAGALGKSFFAKPICARTTDLIIHELGHEAGFHVEKSYHELLTKLGAELTMLALKDPDFFRGAM